VSYDFDVRDLYYKVFLHTKCQRTSVISVHTFDVRNWRKYGQKHFATRVINRK